MRAAWYTKNGEARDVMIIGELPTPVPGPGDVRVRLAVSGLNPSDVKSRRGRPVAGELCVPNSDGAGVIDQVGAGVDSSRVGERVWIWNGQWQRPLGTTAEFIVLPAEQAVLLPDTTEFAAGACLGIPALTAFRAVELLGDIAGKTVLIIGASSAVGHYAAQFALIRGARVIGTVGSVDKARHAAAVGVTHTINYKTESVLDRVLELTGGAGVDGLVDMDFSSTAALLGKGLVAPHGVVACYGSNVMGESPFPFRDIMFKSLSMHFVVVYDLLPADRSRAIETLTHLLSEHRLTHTIGAHFALDDIVAAHEAVEGGKVLGNVVIDLP
jgi:NADPH2:quinone reductase